MHAWGTVQGTRMEYAWSSVDDIQHDADSNNNCMCALLRNLDGCMHVEIV